jgi:3alpha(or 20beta)-hydroxysteroid dehydrogenase
MRAALNPMIRVGGGAIVNISSGAGLKGAPGMCGYAATKWAVRGMTKSAAGEFAIHKIRVNAIFPGPIDTPMLAKNTKAFNDALVAATPLGRMGSVDEIARATLFLASDDSSFITGADVAVDGGGTI